jgi:3'-phosphoadenosine 5'-phosphosulfate sulfotransferase (PAPS reductase)/FAD synthetase
MKNNFKSDNHWFSPIEKELVDIKLNGPKVICPDCGKSGLLFTRWVGGVKEKPTYIIHSSKKGIKGTCELNIEDANDLKAQVKVLKSDVKNLFSNRKTFVLFSGGKDSLCLLAYLKEICNGTKVDLTALFIDTTVGLPENMKYVKKVCRYLGVPLKIVKPKKDYFELVTKWGIPSFKYRWCCRELKIKPVSDYLSKIKEPKVVFDGIRAAESNVRSTYLPIWYHPGFKCLSVSPIFYWSNEKVTAFINKNGIPKNIHHSLGTSTECWCGAYKRKKDFEELHRINPEMFKKLMKTEEKNKSGFTFLYKDGKRLPLRSLLK